MGNNRNESAEQLAPVGCVPENQKFRGLIVVPGSRDG